MRRHTSFFAANLLSVLFHSLQTLTRTVVGVQSFALNDHSLGLWTSRAFDLRALPRETSNSSGVHHAVCVRLSRNNGSLHIRHIRCGQGVSFKRPDPTVSSVTSTHWSVSAEEEPFRQFSFRLRLPVASLSKNSTDGEPWSCNDHRCGSLSGVTE